MIRRNCEISIKKSSEILVKKVNVLYNKHIKCRKSTEIVKTVRHRQMNRWSGKQKSLRRT